LSGINLLHRFAPRHAANGYRVLNDAPDEVFTPFAIAQSTQALFVLQRLDRVHARTKWLCVVEFEAIQIGINFFASSAPAGLPVWLNIRPANHSVSSVESRFCKKAGLFKLAKSATARLLVHMAIK